MTLKAGFFLLTDDCGREYHIPEPFREDAERLMNDIKEVWVDSPTYKNSFELFTRRYGRYVYIEK